MSEAEHSTSSGLTPDEQRITDALVDVWNAFMQLDTALSPDEIQRFREGIHAAQQVFADRALQRAYPEYWN